MLLLRPLWRGLRLPATLCCALRIPLVCRGVACPHLNIVKRFVYGALAAILLIPGAYAALPGDGADGQRLHEANCTGCHDTGVYTRENRQVRSLDALKQQLEGCGHVAKKEFSVAETQSIIKYLNERFYHFQ
jgi:hypothetical protein